VLSWYVKVQILLGRLGERAREEGGASAVEYGLLLALIAAVIITVVKALGSKVSSAYQSAGVGWP
jgi:pilus assembly protein Flp/PilA